MSSGAFRANVLPPIFGEKIAFVYFSIIGVVRRGVEVHLPPIYKNI